MSAVSYSTSIQDSTAVSQNMSNKGFTEKPSTPGCTYVVQPPTEYQKLFLNLQETLFASGLPVANVRIPHSTVVTAKIIDQKEGESWKELEKVQKEIGRASC